MRAIIADELGAPDNYVIRDIELPQAGVNQVRVRIRAAGVGYVDALMAGGGYQLQPPTPFIPGSEFSGEIDAIGSGTSGFHVGDRVCGQIIGNVFAEYLVCDIDKLHRLPASLSFEAGACFLVNYLTALYALRHRGQLRAGETLLVLGASGGVGSAAVQIGKLLGATVIAATSTDEKRAFAAEIGADLTLDYSQADWRATLKQLTGGQGVEVVYDPVGGAFLEPAFRSLRWGGRHLVIGFVAGPIPALPVNLPLLKGASLVGVDVRQFSIKEPSLANEMTCELLEWAGEQKFRPLVGRVFAFEQYREALKQALSGNSFGKSVLLMP